MVLRKILQEFVATIQKLNDKTFIGDDLFTADIAKAISNLAKDPVMSEIFKNNENGDFQLSLLQIGDSAK